jgi:hypothetical protein
LLLSPEVEELLLLLKWWWWYDDALMLAPRFRGNFFDVLPKDSTLDPLVLRRFEHIDDEDSDVESALGDSHHTASNGRANRFECTSVIPSSPTKLAPTSVHGTGGRSRFTSAFVMRSFHCWMKLFSELGWNWVIEVIS